MSHPAFPYLPTHPTPTVNSEYPITPCLSHLFNHIGQVYEQMSNWDNLSQLMSMNTTNGLVNGQHICQGTLPYMPHYRINWNPYFSSGMRDYFEAKGTKKGVCRKIRMIPNALGGGVQAFYDERTVFYEKNEDQNEDQEGDDKKPKKKRKKKAKKHKTKSRSRSRSMSESKSVSMSRSRSQYESDSSIIVREEPHSSFKEESRSRSFDPDNLPSAPNSAAGSGSSKGRRQSSAFASFEVGEGLLGGSKKGEKKLKKEKVTSSSILIEDEDHEEVSKLAEETSKESVENIVESSEIKENPSKCQTVGYVEFPTQKECHLYDKKEDGAENNEDSKPKMNWVDDPCRPETRMCIPDHLKYRNKYRSELYKWCSDPCGSTETAVELPPESERHRKIQYEYMNHMWKCYKEVPLCYNSTKGMRVIRTDLDKYRRKCDQVILVQENGSKSKNEDSEGRSTSRQKGSNASRSNSRSNQSQNSSSTSKMDQNRGSTTSKYDRNRVSSASNSKSISRSNQEAESSKSKPRKEVRKDCHPAPRSKNAQNSKNDRNSKNASNSRNSKNSKNDKNQDDDEDGEDEEPEIVEDEYGSYDANDPRGTEARRKMKHQNSTESMRKRRERCNRARERCLREMRSYERFVIPKKIRSCTAINEAKARAIRRKKEQEKCRRAKTAAVHHHPDDDCHPKYSKYCAQNFINYCCEPSLSDSNCSEKSDVFEVEDQGQGQDGSKSLDKSTNSSLNDDFEKSDMKYAATSSVQASSMEYGEGSMFGDNTSLFDQKSQSNSSNGRRGSVQSSKVAPVSSKYARKFKTSGEIDWKSTKKSSFNENESFLPMNKSDQNQRSRTRSSSLSIGDSSSRRGSAVSNPRIQMSDTDRHKRNSFARDWHDFSAPRKHSRPVESMNDMPPPPGSGVQKPKPSKYSSKNRKNVQKSKSNPSKQDSGFDGDLPKSNLIYSDFYDYDVNQNLTKIRKSISTPKSRHSYQSKPSKSNQSKPSSKSKSPSFSSFESSRKKPNHQQLTREFSRKFSKIKSRSSSSTFFRGSASSSTIVRSLFIRSKSRSLKNQGGGSGSSTSILRPSMLKSISKLDTQKSLEILRKKPTIIWIMGQQQKSGGQDRTNYCIQLCQLLNFKYINMDKVMEKWSKIYQVGNIGQSDTGEHDDFGGQNNKSSSFDSIDNKRLKRAKNNLIMLNKRRKLYEIANYLEKNPNASLPPDVINILIKCAILEQFPAYNGFLIDSFPCSQEESDFFIKTFYQPSLVFYFLSNEWTQNKTLEPKVQTPTLFRRTAEYSERNVEKLCAQFTRVGVKVLNASELSERKIQVLNNAALALIKKSKTKLQQTTTGESTSTISTRVLMDSKSRKYVSKSYKKALSKERQN